MPTNILWLCDYKFEFPKVFPIVIQLPVSKHHIFSSAAVQGLQWMCLLVDLQFNEQKRKRFIYSLRSEYGSKGRLKKEINKLTWIVAHLCRAMSSEVLVSIYFLLCWETDTFSLTRFKLKEKMRAADFLTGNFFKCHSPTGVEKKFLPLKVTN